MTEGAGPGSMYHPCPAGRHWGPVGAAGALCWTVLDGRTYVLLGLRSRHVQKGGTWAYPGGAVDSGESQHDAAMRELAEEVQGIDVRSGTVTGQLEVPCPAGCGWVYSTFVLHVPLHASGNLPRVRVRRGPHEWETSAVRWVSVDQVDELDLHPAFLAAWPALRDQLEGARCG